MPAKVILIGLDSADRLLVERWCDSGDLPFLRSLRERGSYGHLTGFPALGDDATWASFYTGVSPGRHGRYFWNDQGNGTYERRLWRDQSAATQPFWSHLSQSGLRTAVTDVPKCPLVVGLNGVQVADWQVHGRDYLETRSWPPELADDLLRRFGDDHTDRVDQNWLCRLHAISDAELGVFQQHLLRGLEQKTVFASELIQRENWDLFLIVFKEAHCIGHQCWHLLEPRCRRSLPHDNPVKRIYKALDRAVGEIAQKAGPETCLIVFSDLGMGSNYTGEHLLDQLLQRLESKIATPRQRAKLAARCAQRELRALLKGLARAARTPADTLAFQVEHNEISGAIRINLRGREPAGIVLPCEYKHCCDSLSSELLDLRIPETGEPLVEKVLSVDEMYPGERRDRLPDLFVVWARRGRITGARSKSLGTLHSSPPDYRSGNHTEGGFYIGVGPGVLPGHHPRSASILDLAPTVAKLLNTSLPDVDGTSIPELCEVSQNLAQQAGS